jgi:hypothetical protein
MFAIWSNLSQTLLSRCFNRQMAFFMQIQPW